MNYYRAIILYEYRGMEILSRYYDFEADDYNYVEKARMGMVESDIKVEKIYQIGKLVWEESHEN